MAFLTDGQILTHERVDTQLQTLHHHGMADRDFLNTRDGDEAWQIVQIEVVTGVNAQSQTDGQSRSLVLLLVNGLPIGSVKGVGIGLGIELDPIGLGLSCELYLCQIRIEEDRNPRTAVFQSTEDRC